MIDQYGVMGNPVTHSLSPRIHTLFAEQTRQSLCYRALAVAPDDFEAAVRDFFGRPHHGGLSITLPFKEEAWQLSQYRTERAEQAGAVNTLWWDDRYGLCGDNTDGEGLVQDLQVNQGVALSGARILILGAGGAVRGVLGALLEQRPQQIVIANRTPERALRLVSGFRQSESRLAAGTLDGVRGDFSLVINGTSASLQGQVLAIPDTVIGAETVCHDMMYGAGETVFNRWARQAGAARCIDGLGMLVEQAAAQFLRWRGVRPNSLAVLEQLRAELTPDPSK